MKYLVFLTALYFAGCANSEKKSTPPPIEKPAAPPTAPKVVTPPNDQKLSCSHGSETRILEIVKKGNECALNYTKAGKVTAVATASHGSKHCNDSKERIRAKLEKGDFKCI